MRFHDGVIAPMVPNLLGKDSPFSRGLASAEITGTYSDLACVHRATRLDL